MKLDKARINESVVEAINVITESIYDVENEKDRLISLGEIRGIISLADVLKNKLREDE